jgi:hypothetical protein
VLVPQKAYKPRSDKSKRRAGGTTVSGEQPDAKAVAEHQIGVLEANLAKMLAEGVSEDSPKITYHNKLIAKLRKQIADDQ